MSNLSVSSLLQSLQQITPSTPASATPATGTTNSGNPFGAAFTLDINADFTTSSAGTTSSITASGSNNGSKLTPDSLVDITLNIDITSGNSLPGLADQSQDDTAKSITQLLTNPQPQQQSGSNLSIIA